MMNKPTLKKIQILLMLITAVVLCASFYLQFVSKLQPCPLCLMQRFCVFLFLCLGAIGLFKFKKIRVISLLQLVVASSGLYFALRQLWLISLPKGQAPACMADLSVLIRYFPWQDVARALFLGAADCAEETWRLVGIPLAGYSALYFLVMFLGSFYLFVKTRRDYSS